MSRKPGIWIGQAARALRLMPSARDLKLRSDVPRFAGWIVVGKTRRRGGQVGVLHTRNIPVRRVRPVRRKKLVVAGCWVHVSDGNGSGIVVGRKGLHLLAGW